MSGDLLETREVQNPLTKVGGLGNDAGDAREAHRPPRRVGPVQNDRGV
jgi:hypothetical protein